MSTDHPLDRFFARYPAVAVLLYCALVAVLLSVSWLSLADIYERQVALTAATDMLKQIEGRGEGAKAVATPADATPRGSPFIEGQTMTVAGAALQQRVTGAVTKLGGIVLSMQVDLQGTQAKDGLISLIASCELEQPALQELLYELESGMPFLFIDQLVVQAPQTQTIQPGARLRVLLTLSGQWLG